MRCVALFCSGHQHFNLNCLYWVALDNLDILPFSGTLDVNNFGCFIIDFYWLPFLLFSNYKLLVIVETFSVDTCSITFILDMGMVLMETESGAFS